MCRGLPKGSPGGRRAVQGPLRGSALTLDIANNHVIIYIYIYIYMYVCMYVFIYLYLSLSLYIYTHIDQTHNCVFIVLFICMICLLFSDAVCFHDVLFIISCRYYLYFRCSFLYQTINHICTGPPRGSARL